MEKTAQMNLVTHGKLTTKAIIMLELTKINMLQGGKGTVIRWNGKWIQYTTISSRQWKWCIGVRFASIYQISNMKTAQILYAKRNWRKIKMGFMTEINDNDLCALCGNKRGEHHNEDHQFSMWFVGLQ